jgi:Zn-dependent peptidase ImmA (M78 family)/DNA-binding XRE family transcriptional regulator
MVDLNELSMQEVGRRLKLARESAGVRQEQAAQFIEVSRPTLVSIEQGSRRIKMKELTILASHYGTSANALLRREAVHTDLLPRFRKFSDTADNDTQLAVELFNDLIRADVELENVLGIPKRKEYPAEHGISEGDVNVLAEKNAQLLRDHLGVGSGPIADIFSLIEFDLGIRLYQRRLPSKVAGLFTYDDTVGACILLNSNHRIERRAQSAGHEVGHFDGTRRNPEVLELNEKFASREERYADAFGRAFLTPAAAFTEHFKQLRQFCATDKLSRKLVVLLADKFNISREACVRRLEELGLAKDGSWDWFAKKGLDASDAAEVLGESVRKEDSVKGDAARLLSHRMSSMAHAAWERGLMSEGQLSELLKIKRIDLRKIIDEIELDEENHEFLKLAD